MSDMTNDVEVVCKALKRLKEHGIENLIRSGYSPKDACAISDSNDTELPAFERIAEKAERYEGLCK